MDDYITRREHDEFAKRLADQDKRQDKRISLLEDAQKEISRQTAAIERLATCVEAMQAELAKQSERLGNLEGRDGEMWRAAVKYIITLVIGAGAGALCALLGS